MACENLSDRNSRHHGVPRSDDGAAADVECAATTRPRPTGTPLPIPLQATALESGPKSTPSTRSVLGLIDTPSRRSFPPNAGETAPLSVRHFEAAREKGDERPDSPSNCARGPTFAFPTCAVCDRGRAVVRRYRLPGARSTASLVSFVRPDGGRFVGPSPPVPGGVSSPDGVSAACKRSGRES